MERAAAFDDGEAVQEEGTHDGSREILQQNSGENSSPGEEVLTLYANGRGELEAAADPAQPNLNVSDLYLRDLLSPLQDGIRRGRSASLSEHPRHRELHANSLRSGSLDSPLRDQISTSDEMFTPRMMEQREEEHNTGSIFDETLAEISEHKTRQGTFNTEIREDSEEKETSRYDYDVPRPYAQTSGEREPSQEPPLPGDAFSRSPRILDETSPGTRFVSATQRSVTRPSDRIPEPSPTSSQVQAEASEGNELAQHAPLPVVASPRTPAVVDEPSTEATFPSAMRQPASSSPSPPALQQSVEGAEGLPDHSARQTPSLPLGEFLERDEVQEDEMSIGTASTESSTQDPNTGRVAEESDELLTEAAVPLESGDDSEEQVAESIYRQGTSQGNEGDLTPEAKQDGASRERREPFSQEEWEEVKEIVREWIRILRVENDEPAAEEIRLRMGKLRDALEDFPNIPQRVALQMVLLFAGLRTRLFTLEEAGITTANAARRSWAFPIIGDTSTAELRDIVAHRRRPESERNEARYRLFVRLRDQELNGAKEN